MHRRGLTHCYELLYDGDDGEALRAHLCGLRDLDGPQAHHYNSDRPGSKPARSASGRGVVGPRSAPGRGGATTEKTQSPRGPQPDGEDVNGNQSTEALFPREREALVLPTPV